MLLNDIDQLIIMGCSLEAKSVIYSCHIIVDSAIKVDRKFALACLFIYSQNYNCRNVREKSDFIVLNVFIV